MYEQTVIMNRMHTLVCLSWDSYVVRMLLAMHPVQSVIDVVVG
jgi:hypothetical protein